MGRLIEANALLSEMEKYSDDTERSKNEYLFGMQQRLETCIELVEDAPTVDAVPVVRCRDCKRYQHEVGADEYALGWCPFITIHLVSRNGFCAWGKRKEDGNADD